MVDFQYSETYILDLQS
uniref:Uncharacterized protein n=1 Tax=Rhizophora mucronata TaxID=61149 RepID=A0A2P2PA77_RHIMU